MPLQVSCPGCKTVYALKEDLLGKRIRCKHCQLVFATAAPSQPTQADASGQRLTRTPAATKVEQPPGPTLKAPICTSPAVPGAKSNLARLLLIGGGASAFLLLLVVAGLTVFFVGRANRADQASTQTIARADPHAQPADDAAVAHEPQGENPTPARKDPTTPADPAAQAVVPATGENDISPQVLRQIKEATVFVKVSAGRESCTGSGFVVLTQGETAHIVTNHHVVVPEEGLSRFGRPVLPVRVEAVDLVFNSGTQREHTDRAEILATDAERDLAVLKVSGVKDLPKPIDISFKPQYVELMPVYILGFPFGELLAPGKGNPAITIHHGSVSSIQLGDKGTMSAVQIEGAMNPGNSGGPVVDAQGHLVGVAVQSIRGTQIGRAIPPAGLTELLNGHIGGTSFVWPAAASTGADLKADVRLIDPLNKVKKVRLVYLPAADVPAGYRQGKDGVWPELPGAQTADLKIEGQKANGTFSLPAGAESGVITYQVAYVNGLGKPIYTKPATQYARRTGIASGPLDPARPVESPPALSGTPPPGWQVVNGGFRDGAYTVWLPTDGKLDQSENAGGGRRSGRIKVFRNVCIRKDGSLFGVSQLVYPPLLAGETAGARQDSLRNILIGELEGKLVEEKAIKFDDMTGREFVVEASSGMVRVRLLDTASQTYQLMFAGTKEQLKAKEVDNFFNSFQRKPPQTEIVKPAPGTSSPPSVSPPAVGEKTTPAQLPKQIANSIGMKLVLIPAGKFTMGSPPHEKGRSDDEYQREVEITQSFRMGVYPVTQEEYKQVTGRNPSSFSATGNDKAMVQGMDTRRFPVENVSWKDAVAFCRKLSEMPEEKAAGRVYRLPTEAEWEYACRARTTTAFSFGDSLSSEQANFEGGAPYGDAAKGKSLQRTTKVGSYPPNAFGLYDMHGNVCEWCADWYVVRPPGGKDPAVTTQGEAMTRAIRSGNWHDPAAWCRSARRFPQGDPERWKTHDLGFRVVVTQSK